MLDSRYGGMCTVITGIFATVKPSWNFLYLMKKEFFIMAKTQPIKEMEHINALKEYFYERGEIRNYALIVIGLNTSLRISDILTLRWKNVYNFNSFK